MQLYLNGIEYVQVVSVRDVFSCHRKAATSGIIKESFTHKEAVGCAPLRQQCHLQQAAWNGRAANFFMTSYKFWKKG